MGRPEPRGEPCAEHRRQTREQPNRPADRPSKALQSGSRRQTHVQIDQGSAEEQHPGCRPSPSGEYRLRAITPCPRIPTPDSLQREAAMPEDRITNWDLFLSLLPLILLAFVQIAVIYKENTTKVVDRKHFLLIFSTSLAAGVAIGLAGELDVINSRTHGVLFIVFLIIYLFYFYRAVVRRARDAGHSKSIAYLTVIPIINIIIFLYLLFAKSKQQLSPKPQLGNAPPATP